MASQDCPAFVRAITDVLTGAKHARDLAEALVTEAMQQTLVRVCNDYPLDFTQLVAKYQGEIVASCCGMAVAQSEKACGATTKQGKPCGKKAVLNGMCTAHQHVWREQQEVQRRLEADAARRKRDAPQDPHGEELKRVSRRRIVPTTVPLPAMLATLRE